MSEFTDSILFCTGTDIHSALFRAESTSILSCFAWERNWFRPVLHGNGCRFRGVLRKNWVTWRMEVRRMINRVRRIKHSRMWNISVFYVWPPDQQAYSLRNINANVKLHSFLICMQNSAIASDSLLEEGSRRPKAKEGARRIFNRHEVPHFLALSQIVSYLHSAYFPIRCLSSRKESRFCAISTNSFCLIRREGGSQHAHRYVQFYQETCYDTTYIFSHNICYTPRCT